ncbi:hypothetical protein CRM22_006423 [Opisthorchis felineus]|uniref:Uncharacterized protein n=1 Tax=Opisthorchis felineus TaxID=147828 RepID=A0A4S2LL13_OPIFE|nr:hypothetical protein CRM22_006423 [Opisthorchis felineus]
MGDQINKNIEKLHEAGCYLRETEPLQRPNNESLISILDLEKQTLDKKREKLKTRRQEAIKSLQAKGFPTFRPNIDEADHSTLCTGMPPQIQPGKNSLVNPDPDKPQNRLPLELDSSSRDFCVLQRETISLSEPYIPDRVVRSRFRVQLLEQQSAQYKRQNISDIFPQREVQESGSVTSDDGLARKRLNTTGYQEAYGEPLMYQPNTCRQVFPMKTLQTLPDPLRSIDGWSPYHPATSTWQPKNFNSSKFDNMMPRYDFINEDRPYEVCSYAPRIDQIPTYSGCHGTRDKRVEDDNPYKSYKPLNKVRSEVPARASMNLQHNIPGYTGCIVDHVKTVSPTNG